MSEKSSINHLSTGNEFVSLPNVSIINGGVDDIGFMHSSLRACVEMHGSDNFPLLKPVVRIDGEELFNKDIDAKLDSYWIPEFTVSSSIACVTHTVFAPLERRGFVSFITIRNVSETEINCEAGWQGCWEQSCRVANISKPINGSKHAFISSWRDGVPVLELRGQIAMFALALVCDTPTPVNFYDQDKKRSSDGFVTYEGSVYYDLIQKYTLEPGEEINIPLYVGLGTQEVSAIASAQEMKMQGWQRMLEHLKTWLAKHEIDTSDEYYKHLINVSSFYNYFYSQAITLDNEKFVLTSARSSANKFCASYRDSDAMTWSLPAVLQINWPQARKMLICAFTTQLPNVGVHSRFIDGTVLEPGIKLDHLCAPLRALYTYVELTGDKSILFDRRVQTGVNTIQQILAVQRHNKVALFETLLLPSGEPSKYPYVCYSNVLVWRALRDISHVYGLIRDLDRADEANKLAIKVKNAIMNNFIVGGPFGETFAKAIDLEGGYELGDDPVGSIQLMSHLGFCSPDDKVFNRTVAWINSEFNPFCEANDISDANGVELSVFRVINGLFTSHKNEALNFIRQVEFDNMIACSGVKDGKSRVVSSRAFATCAGYLSFALRFALNASSPENAAVKQLRRPSETLYQPPPKTNQDTKKARL